MMGLLGHRRQGLVAAGRRRYRASAGEGAAGRWLRGRIGAVAVLVAMAVAMLPAMAAASSAGRAAGPGRPGGQGWTRIWIDSFDGPTGAGVDPSVWKYNTGTGIFGTGEIETMTSSTSNVHLDGHGDLDITALGNGQSWTSGRIQTISRAFGAPAGGEMAVTAAIR
jgi:hypothetical protein